MANQITDAARSAPGEQDPELELAGEPAEEAEEVEEELDPEVAARRAAALAHVRQYGDPILRTEARWVEHFDSALHEQIRRMAELMVDAIGVGLAATQVGVLNRVLVYRVPPQASVVPLVNPEVAWSGDDAETMEEGCLSIPDVHGDVERSINIRVLAQDEHGEPLEIEASGLEARVLQHEIDHLNGVLMLDRISRQQRKIAMRTLREAQQTA